MRLNLSILTEISFFNNSLQSYLLFLLIFCAGSLITRLIIGAAVVRVKQWAAKTESPLDDFLIGVFERIVLPALYFAAFYLGVRVLVLPPFLDKIIGAVQC